MTKNALLLFIYFHQSCLLQQFFELILGNICFVQCYFEVGEGFGYANSFFSGDCFDVAQDIEIPTSNYKCFVIPLSTIVQQLYPVCRKNYIGERYWYFRSCPPSSTEVQHESLEENTKERQMRLPLLCLLCSRLG